MFRVKVVHRLMAVCASGLIASAARHRERVTCFPIWKSVTQTAAIGTLKLAQLILLTVANRYPMPQTVSLTIVTGITIAVTRTRLRVIS